MKEKKYLFNNGAGIRVIIPNTSDRDIIFAAEEIRRVLNKATLSPVTIYSTIEVGNQGLISLGDTYLAKEKEVKTELSEVGKQGYKIKTVDGNIFIYAATPMGILNGAYGFLEKVVNYDYFYKDVMQFDYTPTLEFPDFDITEIPDIQDRVVSQGYQAMEYSEKRRFRMVDYREVFPDTPCGAFHNAFGYLAPEKYLKNHPEWFSDNIHTRRARLGQLCYTARGDKNSYTEMVEETAKNMVSILSNVKHNEIVLASNDAWLDWNENCTCPACEAEKQKYGSYAGSVIKFLNNVSEKAEQLFKELKDSRAETFKVVFYAYHQLSIPPVHFEKDEEGNQVYDSEGKPAFSYESEVKFNKHVAIIYARSWCDLIRGFYHPVHKHYLNDIIAWNELTQKELLLWTYDRYFDQCGNFIPYDSFRGMQSLYKFAKENKVRWLYNEACLTHEAGTAFTFLKGYLESKLGWKTDLDIKTLEKKFFKAMYGSQSEEMYSIYQTVRAYSKRQIDEEGFPVFTCSREILYPVRWDKQVLQSIYDRMLLVEKNLIKKGELKEAKLVEVEEIYPLGVLVRCFRDSYAKEVYDGMVKKLRDYFFEFGFTTLGSGELNWIPDFFNMLGMPEKDIWQSNKRR